jgi:hypothetical protein
VYDALAHDKSSQSQFSNSLTTSLRAWAKQSMAQQAESWIASSQLLLAMTARHSFAISPNAFSRGILLFPPSPN